MSYTFNEKGVRRIARAVRKSEREQPHSRRGRQRQEVIHGTFWAELTGEGMDDEAGLYDWKLIYPAPGEASGWIDADPAVTGTKTAREANDASGLTGQRVELRYNGLTTDTTPKARFLFTAAKSGRLAFKITSNIDTGQWNAKSFTGPPVLNPGGALTEEELGTLSETEDLIVRAVSDSGGAFERPLDGLVWRGDVVGTAAGKTYVDFNPPGGMRFRIKPPEFAGGDSTFQVAFVPYPEEDHWVDQEYGEVGCPPPEV